MLRIKEVHIRWIGIFVLGIGLPFILEHDGNYSIYRKIAISIFFAAYCWNGAWYLFLFLRKKYPRIGQTPKRLIITVVCLSIFLTIGNHIPKILLGMTTFEELFNFKSFFQYAYINFPLTFFIGIIYEAVYFFDNWKATVKANEALKNQQIRTQFEVLRNQMSPHFLFNCLNTLTALIAENQENAIDFTQKLSDVYRYILQNKEKDLIKLSDELAFVNDYIFLLQMRYPENLHVRINLHDQLDTTYIAPLTLQILVENCIKHNVISQQSPLNIDLYIENLDTLVVKNNFQPKQSVAKSTKTGLDNIKKRYEFLIDRKIEIIDNAQHFIVKVPLIKVYSEQDYIITKGSMHEGINN